MLLIGDLRQFKNSFEVFQQTLPAIGFTLGGDSAVVLSPEKLGTASPGLKSSYRNVLKNPTNFFYWYLVLTLADLLSKNEPSIPK